MDLVVCLTLKGKEYYGLKKKKKKPIDLQRILNFYSESVRSVLCQQGEVGEPDTLSSPILDALVA